MDGRAHTSTELAIVAGINPSTASVHLSRLQAVRLVKLAVQGRHRYYSLSGKSAASLLESLSVFSGNGRKPFLPAVPHNLCVARTCYDHAAGRLGVALHDRFRSRGWLVFDSAKDGAYQVTAPGACVLANLGIDTNVLQKQRRRFAYPCLDWSERKPHIGGAVGAALLTLALQKKWVACHADSRVLDITCAGRREMKACFGLEFETESIACLA